MDRATVYANVAQKKCSQSLNKCSCHRHKEGEPKEHGATELKCHYCMRGGESEEKKRNILNY